MATSDFFESQDERSRAKTEIVSKYFKAWARIVLRHAKNRGQNVGFVDLFAGPGRYEDGTPSTPLEVLRLASESSDLAERFESHFNDKDLDSVAQLKQSIDQLPELNAIRIKPKVSNLVVTNDLIPTIERAGEIPTLFFVDPWGYKGLSIELLSAAIRGWGCDLIFFFNYNRISLALPNEVVNERINSVFGTERANSLREKLRVTAVRGHNREMLILNEMGEAIRATGAGFVLPFRFRAKSGDRAGHYLIFVSKHFRGFHLMKEIMSSVGSSTAADALVFEFHSSSNMQLSLMDDFFADQEIERLEQWILDYLRGRTLTVMQLYERHEIARRGTAFKLKDYKTALGRMEQQGSVILDPPRGDRRLLKDEITMPDRVKVTLPSEK